MRDEDLATGGRVGYFMGSPNPLGTATIREMLKYFSKKKGESVNHLIDCWRDFKKEQPALSALLLKELQSARGTAEKGYIAHGAWIIFKALKVQEEVDELNEAWGD